MRLKMTMLAAAMLTLFTMSPAPASATAGLDGRLVVSDDCEIHFYAPYRGRGSSTWTDVYTNVFTESYTRRPCTGVGIRAYYWGGPNGRDSRKLTRWDTRGNLSIDVDVPGRVYKLKGYGKHGHSSWRSTTMYPV